MKLPPWFNRGQYLQEEGLLHGLTSISLSFSPSGLVLVDTLTKWFDESLFWQRQKVISESKSGLVVFPRISQLDVNICLSGGLRGLNVC